MLLSSTLETERMQRPMLFCLCMKTVNHEGKGLTVRSRGSYHTHSTKDSIDQLFCKEKVHESRIPIDDSVLIASRVVFRERDGGTLGSNCGTTHEGVTSI